MSEAKNYNDGKWHGWNGGVCPVHPRSDVEAITFSGYRATTYAMGWTWGQDDPSYPENIVAFRVVKEHREPREWWLFGPYIYDQDPRGLYYGEPAIHVREVLE